MKKRGFTLAEVLITLGIVGVVAALTAPALVMSSRNEANAARLSTVVSNIENAFQTAIIQEGVDNLYGTAMWQNMISGGTSDANIQNFVGHLGQYMIVNGYKKTQNEFYGSNQTQTHVMSATGGTGNTQAIPDNPIAIETKNGATIFMTTTRNNDTLAQDREDAIRNGGTLYTIAGTVAIDVNGKNSPNVFGRDIFFFVVGENGVLYPYGGRDVNRHFNGGLWDNAGAQYACTDAAKGGAATAGMGCTARVIAEGYKINY